MKDAFKHLYNSTFWKRARLIHLASHPICCYCWKQGMVTAATVVDHIKPHRGDVTLFRDPKNWQSLCDTHHSATKQKEEAHGKPIGIGLDGWPIN